MSESVSTLLPLLAASLLLGLASGVHCIGMCGGIVAALSAGAPGARSGSAGVLLYSTHGATRGAARAGVAHWQLQAGYNAGRIGAYALAGAAAGTLGSAGAYAAGAADLQLALYVAANLMLIMIGLHLAGLSAALARFESVGRPVWRRMQPLAARVLPARSVSQAVLAGSLWGWLPCGLVYAMLATALASGSASHGALAMLAFGLGTLPHMMLAGLALTRLRGVVGLRAARVAVGGLVLAFGVFGLARAADLDDLVRRALLCL